MKLIFTILLIGILVGTEVDLFIPSFPELRSLFHLSPLMVQLTLSVNFVAYCICALWVGTLGDRYNRRLIIIASLCVFILGSLLCVYGQYYSFIVIGRLLQGVGMAAPNVLSFVVIADVYALKKQPAIMGILNGVITLSMACAPIIGSYVALYFGWRGNFTLLLCLGVAALIASVLWIPHHIGDKTASISLKTYWPLLKSKKLLMTSIAMCAVPIAYWVFIGMAPILYMENLHVELKHFGYYQGALALTFSLVSILSPKILSKLGLKNCLMLSSVLCLIGILWMGLVLVFWMNHPLMITLVMLVFSVAAVFPLQILYPFALTIFPKSKAKVAALITGIRLLSVAFLLEIVSYFYLHSFFPIGCTIIVLALLALFFIRYVVHRYWVALEE